MLCSVLTLPTMADDGYDYPYMVFTTTDGTQTSLSVEGLQMTVADGSLLVSNPNENVTFPLSDLAEMHFSETEIATGIDDVQSTKNQVQSTIYDLSGRKVSAQTLTPGVYVMKQGSVTRKILVR